MWKFHAIHHSTEHLDWVSGFRAHPFDGTLIAPAFAFLIAAGFSPEITGVFAIFQIVLGLLLHANVRFRFRWLHPFLGTPEMHHWHHRRKRLFGLITGQLFHSGTKFSNLLHAKGQAPQRVWRGRAYRGKYGRPNHVSVERSWESIQHIQTPIPLYQNRIEVLLEFNKANEMGNI